MPTYDYECQTCGHQFEAVQSMKDPHLTSCPKPGCGGLVERKVGRGSGIIFKGSGFYQTDYRSDSYKAAAKKDSESGGGSATTPSKDAGASTAAPSTAAPSTTPPSTAAASTTAGTGGTTNTTKAA